LASSGPVDALVFGKETAVKFAQFCAAACVKGSDFSYLVLAVFVAEKTYLFSDIA